MTEVFKDIGRHWEHLLLCSGVVMDTLNSPELSVSSACGVGCQPFCSTHISSLGSLTDLVPNGVTGWRGILHCCEPAGTISFPLLPLALSVPSAPKSRTAAFRICTSFPVRRSPSSPSWETPCFCHTRHCTLILALVTGCLLLDLKFEHSIDLQTTFKKLQIIHNV